MSRRTALFLSLVVVLPATVVAAQAPPPPEGLQPIRFARHPSVSPDGQMVAFSFQGDIWTAPVRGGTATRVTLHEAHDQLPFWSPDGRYLAFSSKREGGYDIYMMPAAGGKPRRLTYHSADDLATGWTPDGTRILFSSSREATRTSAVYSVDVATGATRLLAHGDQALMHASVSPDGKELAVTSGGQWTRRHYRGSANSNLMRFPLTEEGPGSWLVREPANERWPLYSPDGRTLYFVSDKTGANALWALPRGSRNPVQLTPPSPNDVHYPSLSANGEVIVYEHQLRLWSLPTRGGTPREIVLYAPSDDRTNPVSRQTFTSGIQEFQLSEDGRQIAFVVRGEVFTMPAGPPGEPVRVTSTPNREEDVVWAPDGSRLVYSSDRDGNQELYAADLKAKTETRLTSTPGTAEHSPVFSPDGKWVAYLRGYNGAQLCLLPAAGGEPRVLVSDPAIRSPAWSPDSRWLCFSRSKSHSAGAQSDLFLIDVTSPEPRPVNITRYPGNNVGPVWSRDGRRIFFGSDRGGRRQLYSVTLADPRLNPEGMGAGEAPARVDLDEIHTRARQVTRSDTDPLAYAVARDGNTVILSAPVLGRNEFWRVSTTGPGLPTRITVTGEGSTSLQLSPDGQRLYYLVDGALRSLPLPSAPPATPPTPVAIPFRVEMDIDVRAEFHQMFDEAWRKMRDGFYDEKMHGVDWTAVRDYYRPAVAHLTEREDFYTLFALVLGELNASHTGLTPGGGDRGPATASLGIVPDPAHTGPGVRVKSRVPWGPADRPGARLEPGELILKVDGVPVLHTEHLHQLLADKSGRPVEVTVNSRPADEGARTVRLRPVSLAEHRSLVYDQWVREREQQVEKLSGGRLGYLHLNAMNDTNLEKFRRAVFGDLQEKQGLVLDVRFNGGGSIADEILAILQDRIFSVRTIRGDPNPSPAPIYNWTRPTLVMINEASFSNAEAFPWGFKALGLGKVVGVPTYGAVIGTGGTTLIDGSRLRMPGTGAYTLDGINMENNGCPPDLLVENTPEDQFRGNDRQLAAAVEELLKDPRLKPTRMQK